MQTFTGQFCANEKKFYSNFIPCMNYGSSTSRRKPWIWSTWSEFANGKKAIVEQILTSKERIKSRRAGLWESQSASKLTIWVRSFEKNYNRAHKVYCFHQNRLASPYDAR